ncbi:Uncharacterised protein [Bordetella pertussis]|nr:Uncharacterised protein [Bordetella pertussis]
MAPACSTSRTSSPIMSRFSNKRISGAYSRPSR